MKNKEVIELLKYMKSDESYESLCEVCDTAIAALKFREHFDALKEFQHLEEVVRCDDCRYNLICAQRVTMTEFSHNTISTGGKEIKFCSYGKRRED